MLLSIIQYIYYYEFTIDRLCPCPFSWFENNLPASCFSERMESRLATVTLVTHHSWLTAASAVTITLCAERT